MVLLCFILGSLIVGLVMYLPFFVWFRLRRQPDGGVIARELEISLHVAFVRARTLRYQTITLEQLLLALLENPSAADVLRACSIDVEAMRESASAIVRDTAQVAGGTEPVQPAAAPEFQRVLQRAIARVLSARRPGGHGRPSTKTSSWLPAILRPAASKTVNGADLLVALLEESDGRAVEELRRHGVTRLAVTNSIAHGIGSADAIAKPPNRVDGAAEMAVVIENDDFTPMEFVVEALQRHLELDLESAVRVMLEVHHEGRAVAGRFPADIAADKAERVRAMATQAGHPFRCVVVAPEGA